MRILIYSLLFIMIAVVLFIYIGIQQYVIFPEIQLSSNELHFTIDSANHYPSRQIIQITNSKGGKLNWHIRREESQRDDYWLEILPPGGTCVNGRSKKVEIGVKPNHSLQPGQYHCTLLVSGDTSEIEKKKIDIYLDATQLPTITQAVKKARRILRVPEEYPAIGQAIASADNGDKIVVGQGTYYENLNFNGKNIELTSVHPYNKNAVASTVIRGSGGKPAITFSGTENASCKLVGFTITGSITKGNGGGIDGNGTYATILKCVITQNKCGGDGGGIYGCNGIIANCEITNNFAANGGGLANCNSRSK